MNLYSTRTTIINFLNDDFVQCITHPWKETGVSKGLLFCQDFLTAGALSVTAATTVELNLVSSLPVVPVLPGCTLRFLNLITWSDSMDATQDVNHPDHQQNICNAICS